MASGNFAWYQYLNKLCVTYVIWIVNSHKQCIYMSMHVATIHDTLIYACIYTVCNLRLEDIAQEMNKHSKNTMNHWEECKHKKRLEQAEFSFNITT